MIRKGYGQVEPNHLSAPRNGQVYAQLPAADSITQLENGQFVKYDYANGEVNFTGKGEWMLVFNEIKFYDRPWREHMKDWVYTAEGVLDGEITPRVFKTSIGDIYTTNCFKAASTGRNVETTMDDLAAGDILQVNAEGFLEKAATATDGEMQWEVAKVYTMPDGQVGVKIRRIA